VKWPKFRLSLKAWLVALVALAVVCAIAAPSTRQYVQNEWKKSEREAWRWRLQNHGCTTYRFTEDGGPWMEAAEFSDCSRFSMQAVLLFAEQRYQFDHVSISPCMRANDATLAPLASVTSLRHLILCKTGVGDKGLDFVKSLVNLEVLDLHGCNVDKRTIENLAQLPKLRELTLWGTPIRDEDLRPLEGHLSLEHIDLFATQVTPGIGDILSKIPNLQTYRLPFSITDDESDEIRARLRGSQP
jgi:hypothetical protein